MQAQSVGPKRQHFGHALVVAPAHLKGHIGEMTDMQFASIHPIYPRQVENNGVRYAHQSAFIQRFEFGKATTHFMQRATSARILVLNMQTAIVTIYTDVEQLAAATPYLLLTEDEDQLVILMVQERLGRGSVRSCCALHYGETLHLNKDPLIHDISVWLNLIRPGPPYITQHTSDR